MDIPINKSQREGTEVEAPSRETADAQEWQPSQSMDVFGKLRRVRTEEDADGGELPASPGQGGPPAGEKLSLEPGESGLASALGWIAKGAVWAALFLTPLFYFFSSDTLGLSKSLLISALAMVALASWVGKVIAGGRVEFRSTWPAWAAVAVVLVAVISSMFSSSLWVSVFGAVGRFGFSAAALTSYLVLFLVVLGVFTKRDALYGVLASLAAAGVLAVVSLFQFFEVFILPGAVAEREAFSPVGSLFALSLFAAATIPVILELLGTLRRAWVRAALAAIGVLNIVILLTVGFRAAWMVLALALLVHIALTVWREGLAARSLDRQRRVILPVLVFVLAFIMWVLPNTPSINIVGVPVEVSPSYSSGIGVLRGAWSQNPLFGSGPETFPYAYGRHKTAAINQTNFWGVNFSDANAEVITWMVTTGIAGTLALLAFVVLTLAAVLRSLKGRPSLVAVGLLSGWMLILIAKFFYPTPIALELFFWVFPALLIVRTGAGRERAYAFTAGSAHSLALFIVSIVVLVAAVGGLYFTGQRWAAEAHFTDVIDDQVTPDNVVDKIRDTARAVQLHPRDARYFETLSRLLITRTQLVLGEIAARPIEQRQASQEEAQQIQGLVAQSLQSMERSLQLDPENVSVRIAAGNAYVQVSGLVEGAIDRAAVIYEGSVALEPVNPFLRTQLAQLYLTRADFFGNQFVTAGEDIARAKEQLERAVSLSENYSNARYFLGLILDRQGDRAGAIAQFERIEQFNPDNEVVRLILNNLRLGRPALSPPVPEDAEPPTTGEEEQRGIPPEQEQAQ